MDTKLLDSVRLIRLMKSADGRIENNESESAFEENSFYTFGFFDELTYIKPKGDNKFSYENCLGIKYPGSDKNVFAEQLFCIYDGKTDGTSYEVFEYAENDKPFLGLVFASINKVDCNDFKDLTEKSIEVLCDRLKEKKFLSEIYKTLNCADLCIAIRTDALEDIYDVFALSKEYFSSNKISSNITAIQCISSLVKSFEEDHAIFNTGHKVTVALRLNNAAAYPGCHAEGVLGKGGSEIRVTFEEYFKNIYPKFIECKYSEIRTSIAIVHERIFFGDLQTEASPFGGCTNENEDEDYNKKKEYIKTLRSELRVVERFFENKNVSQRMPSDYHYKLKEQVTSVKELINTFCDFWFQYTPINGYAFYVQCHLMLEFVNRCLEDINDEIDTKNKEDIILICEMLKLNTEKAIDCINNYNKMLQFLNQDSVNYPTHEIQAKVNTEKYLLAYTAYLHDICRAFYEQYDMDGDWRRKVLPITLLDMNADRISAFTLFDKLAFEKENRVACLYAVVFPNYRRFANIRHVLPLLTHEVSHEFRYMKRETRNAALIRYLLNTFSVSAVREMMRESEIRALTINGLQTLLSNAMRDVLYNLLVEKPKTDISKWHVYEIADKLEGLIKENLLAFSDRTSESVVYNTNKESLICLNRKIICDSLKELYRWMFNKARLGGLENKAFIYKSEYESLINKLNDSNCEIEHGTISKTIKNLHEDINTILEMIYEDFYSRFLNHLSNVMSRSCDELRFEYAQLILTEIQNFYAQSRGGDKDQENILVKFCEDVINITVNLNVIGDASPITAGGLKRAEENIGEIFKELQKTAEDCCDEKSKYHIFLRSAKYRNIFTTLGLCNEKSDVFCSLFKEVLYRISGSIGDSLNEAVNCYEEICADLGMCAAFDFSPFGYLHFLSHIFSEENTDQWQKGKSFAVDRVNTVITTLLVHKCRGKSNSLSKDDMRTEFNSLRNELCKCLLSYIEQDFSKESDSFYKREADSKKVLEKYVNKLQIMDIQYSDEEIYKHCSDLYSNYILRSDWVKNCSKDETVKAIGKYYNNSLNNYGDREAVKETYFSFFNYHIKFAFDYYCKHRNVYNALLAKINSEEKVLTQEECIKTLYQREGKQN